ncbi:hypothetical protein KY342_02160 [Candidatus Woesearchaeota archaeon]|nr:hypothetical protein [Candidatus Woesearchaeota archaeon]
MVMASVKCPECGFDIEVELPKNKSLIIKTCPKCKKDICRPDGGCITVCQCPCKGE